MTRREMAREYAREGYFGIGIWHPKTGVNVGTLLRTAKTYDAAFVATVGIRRYQTQASDTCKTPLSVPLHHYTDIDDLIEHLPHSCPLVGVELSPRATSLTGFWHPTRAMYLLGAEDHGIPEKVLDRCHYVVQIPSPAKWSLNVATAGALVIHDRYVKRQKGIEAEQRSDQRRKYSAPAGCYTMDRHVDEWLDSLPDDSPELAELADRPPRYVRGDPG